ncbi:MAG: GNAT family N-acetyltransferase, partial [Spirochaetales bacterium]|nr:GNAT family N-acetyltransferase [Spirochaetales bacterium]
NDSDTDILGAMLYSPSSRHIGWLAVHPNHRRTGIGTALANYLIRELGVSEPILVKTFLESDEPGESAHRFYNSLGFEQECIVDDKDGRNAGHPFHLLIKKECL